VRRRRHRTWFCVDWVLRRDARKPPLPRVTNSMQLTKQAQPFYLTVQQLDPRVLARQAGRWVIRCAAHAAHAAHTPAATEYVGERTPPISRARARAARARTHSPTRSTARPALAAHSSARHNSGRRGGAGRPRHAQWRSSQRPGQMTVVGAPAAPYITARSTSPGHLRSAPAPRS